MTEQAALEQATALAVAYNETINGPANAWGQHCHSIHGRSDYIMERIFKLVGEEKGWQLINQKTED